MSPADPATIYDDDSSSIDFGIEQCLGHDTFQGPEVRHGSSSIACDTLFS
jgi:hypothetical protein